MWLPFNEGPPISSLLQFCQPIYYLFKEENKLLPSMINSILKYLAKIRDIHKDTGTHLKSEQTSTWFTKILLITEPTKSCCIYFAPWYINRCTSSYKGKQITFSRKQEGKKNWGKYDTCVYWEGSILDGSAILVSIFDSNYSSWFFPLFPQLMLKQLIMSN